MNRHQGRQTHRRASTIQGFFSGKGWWRVLQFALLGVFIAVNLHAGIAVGLQESGNWQAENTEPIRITSNLPLSSAISPPAQLVQQAEAYYQAGQLLEAIALWQQAATQYETEGDSLGRPGAVDAGE
jgi:hypothetical protein